MHKPRGLSSQRATNTINSTIDSILSRGAQKLYDQYITAKISGHMGSDFYKTINNIFGPMENNREEASSKLHQIHESIIEKIHVADLQKRPSNKQQKVKLQTQTRKIRFSKSYTLQHTANEASNTNFTGRRSCCASKKSKKNSTVQPSSSRLVRCPNAWFEDSTKESHQIWKDKRERDEQTRKRDEQSNRQLQKSIRIKKQLYQQFRQWEEDNKNIPFDHESGRIIQKEPKPRETTNNKKKNIISLHYGYLDSEQSSKQQPPPSRQVSSVRKVTSFTRPKRKRIVIDQTLNDQSYNNNGNRQKSSIPYVQAQEGVILRQQGGAVSEEINIDERIKSASLTHRTFKSFSKEIMESNRYGRTICTATSAARTRMFIPHDSKQTNKTSLCSKRDSILWKNHKSLKNHKIDKNPQLVQNYFGFDQQLVS